jgi:hypothetical protein
MAPFRPVPDGFRRVSIEILYSIALGRPAKARLCFGFSKLSSPCYATEQGHLIPVISLDHCMSKSS